MTKIKICGITNAADARNAVAAGADYIGLVFAHSPRQVTAEQAKEICDVCDGAITVGVFQDETLLDLVRTVQRCGLGMVQLHGNEGHDYITQLKEHISVPVIKAITPEQADDELLLGGLKGAGIDYLLLDSRVKRDERVVSYRWKPGKALLDTGLPLFLAGGLTPSNVGLAISMAEPFAVDVSSGVESEPGVKDIALMRDFVDEAQARGLWHLEPLDREGRFGVYGGSYVPETLTHALAELEAAYREAIMDEAFNEELAALRKDFCGRETPLYFARRLSEHCGSKIYLKREDLLHTGAHKINNCIGQVLLARRMGKKRIVAETGAGQHGVATSTVSALFGLDCTVYMGAEDMRRQAPNVQRMNLLGATVVPAETGSKTLKDATNEAIRDWVTNVEDSYYLIGSTVGPHPYPRIVRDFQYVIGSEAREQILATQGRLPDAVVACVGGGSNAMGIFSAFLRDRKVRLVGVEAGGTSVALGLNAAAISYGRPGVLHGSYSYLLQDEGGQVQETKCISAGIDYPGVGPEHSFLKDIGRAEYVAITDDEAIEAFQLLSRMEGIIPALESSHAISQALKIASQQLGQSIVVSLSGRGDKDLAHAIAAIEAREKEPVHAD